MGTSIGASLVFLITLNYSPNDIEKIFTKIDPSDYVTPNIDNLVEKWGLCSNSRLCDILRSAAKQKGILETCTFTEYNKLTKKNLCFLGTNITSGESEIFSHTLTPDMNIFTALEISSAFPFLFHPIHYKGNIYVDGGVTRNFPIEISPNPETTLSIILSANKLRPCVNFIDYIHNLLNVYSVDRKIYACHKK